MRRAGLLLMVVVGLMGTGGRGRECHTAGDGGWRRDRDRPELPRGSGLCFPRRCPFRDEDQDQDLRRCERGSKRGIATGRIHAWETNVTTGKTVFRSISGPSFFDASGALVMGTGASSGHQLQDGTWIHANGLITFDANGLVIAVRGHVEPLCDALA